MIKRQWFKKELKESSIGAIINTDIVELLLNLITNHNLHW